MDFIKGMTYGYQDRRGDWLTTESRRSMDYLLQNMGVNTVTLAVETMQAHTYSDNFDWQNEKMLADSEVSKMIEYVHQNKAQVFLKPMIDVADGTWRAYINFLDHAEPCEPSWENWFTCYQNFICHYAQIAEANQVEGLVIGCELVNTDRREANWRVLIQKVREIYSGPITYNADKYQEDQIKWWDAVDIISSSGYYPINEIKTQFQRIAKVAKDYNKPFIFAEAGCPTQLNAKEMPNSWLCSDQVSLTDQNDWYQEFFAEIRQNKWIKGTILWDWKSKLYAKDQAFKDLDYAVYGKPAEKVVKENYLLI